MVEKFRNCLMLVYNSRKNTITALIGASGSGKSTFLRLVLREERPTSGSIHVLGRDLSQVSTWKVPQLRREIGTVFQDFRLLENKTVLENVAIAPQVIGKPRYYIRSAVPEALELVGLKVRKSVYRTSFPVVNSSVWQSPAHG